MTKKLFIVLTLILSLAFMANILAQGSWTYSDRFPVTGGGHGIEVDPDGKIWFVSYYANDIVVNGADSIMFKSIYCFNADGTQASFSPIRTLDVPGVGVDSMLNAARGLGLDGEGNLLYSAFDKLYRIDYQTGECLGMVQPVPGASLTQAWGDENGYVYIGTVLAGNPIFIYDEDFEEYSRVVEAADVISRALIVTPDGKDLYYSAVTGTNGVLHYYSEDGPDGTYEPIDTIGVDVDGVKVLPSTNCINFDRDGNIWFASKYDVTPAGWWCVDPDMDYVVIDSLGTPLLGAQDTTDLNKVSAARGIAFNEDGTIAYTSDFESPIPFRIWEKSAGDMVKVTFWANTATIPDTMNENSTVQVRGGTSPLTWDGSSPVKLTNIDGDYWKGEGYFPKNSTIQYKFFTNVNSGNPTGTDWEHQGWECNTDDASGNRILVTGESSVTLPVEFANGIANNKPQLFKPWGDTDTDSTFVVWVRVNMQGWTDFNPEMHMVGVRGSNTTDWGQTGNLSWGSTVPLTAEAPHANGGQYPGNYFYSGAIHVPNSYAGISGLQFKFVVHYADAALDEDWGNMVMNPDVQYTFPVSGADTTIKWVWFNNQAPQQVDHADTVVVTFRADMSPAIQAKGYVQGDTLLVQAGTNYTATEMKRIYLRKQGLTNIYQGTDTLVSTIGQDVFYNYYVQKNGRETREVFYDFNDMYPSNPQSNERRKLAISGATASVSDSARSATDSHRAPKFQNLLQLSKDVLLTLECDLRPPIHELKVDPTDSLDDIQGDADITSAMVDSIYAWGVYVNGPLTGTWGTWNATGLANFKMFDDGTHGDATAGDTIFTIQIQLNKDSANGTVGQEFKFGIRGGDNEPGQGGYGLNHIENVNDDNATFTLRAQFGSINPTFYDHWDFNTNMPVAINETPAMVRRYNLEQNYPNPFNPSTTIRFTISQSEKVMVRIFDITGKKVMTLVDQRLAAGTHQIVWDGKDDNGRIAPSGIYFYQLKTESYLESKKMVLVK